MFNNISKHFLSSCGIFLLLAVLFSGCSGQNSSGTNSGEWQIDYAPGGNGKYAAIHVFSSKTGEYSQMYASEGVWKKNPNFPSVTPTITKGNLRMQYVPDTERTLPGLNVYSATTGEWQQFYLQDKTWKKNTNFPQPTITLPKGNLEIEYIAGSAAVLPTLVVSCSKTKQFQMLYLDNGAWKINPAFPTGTNL